MSGFASPSRDSAPSRAVPATAESQELRCFPGPVLIEGNTQLLFGGMGRLSENCVLSIKNRSHSIPAEIVVPEKGAEGGFKHFMVDATTPIPAGEHQVRMEFSYAGGSLGKGGTVTLFTDARRSERATSRRFS